MNEVADYLPGLIDRLRRGAPLIERGCEAPREWNDASGVIRELSEAEWWLGIDKAEMQIVSGNSVVVRGVSGRTTLYWKEGACYFVRTLNLEQSQMILDVVKENVWETARVKFAMPDRKHSSDVSY